MKLSIQVASTSQTVNVFVRDSSSTTGGGLTGLVFNSPSLVAYYALPRAAAVSIALVTQTVTGAYSSGGFVEISSANMPGWYRLDVPDAAIASGRFVSIHLKGATNMAPLPLEIELTGWNNQDAVRGGLTALPNANAAAANGLPILGTNASAISFTAGFTISSTTGDAFTITSSGGNGNGINVNGNGTGDGVKITAGATGRGLHALGGATSGAGARFEGQALNSSGFHVLGFGNQSGLRSEGGATGAGALFIGGATSGNGISITTTSGDGISSLPTAGSGMVLTGNGTSKHGLISTGGTAGTSDGISAVAGTGGVPIRGNITGNITGNLSGSVGSVTAGVTIAAGQLFVKKNTQITITFPMTDAVTHAPATGLTVTARRSIDGAAVANCANSVTELSLGLYSLVLAATDTNGTEITYIFSAVGADTKFLLVVTQA